MSNSLEARTDAFLLAARQRHGDKYDYSRVIDEYRNAHTAISIGCSDHGIFNQTPNEHRRGAACPDCSARRGSSAAARHRKFLDAAKAAHGSRYSYDAVEYVDQHTHITITCRSHGHFQQRPDRHIAGHNCPTCAHTARFTTRRNTATKPPLPKWWN